MPEFSQTVSIAAPRGEVWRALVDVDRWAEWTTSVRKTARIDGRPFGLGSRIRIEQPRLRPATWVVTDLRPGAAFVWESRSPGLIATALHAVEDAAIGTRVTLQVRFTGPLAPLVTLIAGSLTQRYMAIEASGLKTHCERPR